MVKKITIFITIFGLIFGSIPLFTKNVKAQENENIINLASPNLQGKVYLGNGEYKLYNSNDITIDYNVYSGVFTINGTALTLVNYIINALNVNTNEYTYTIKTISGDKIESPNMSYPYIQTLIGSQFTLYGLNNSITNNITTQSINLRYFIAANTVFNNYQFKLQLEKGTTATSYQVPIGALEQHSQIQYDKGYNDGLQDGYVDGLDDGLISVFDNQNLIFNAEFLSRGTTAPDNRFFGYKIELQNEFYFSNIDIFGLELFPELADLTLTSDTANIKQGIRVIGNNGSNSYSFIDFQENYNFLTTIKGNQSIERKYHTIHIILAIDNPSMPAPAFNALQQDIYEKIGVYLNNMVLSNEAMEHYFTQFYNDGYDDASNDYEPLLKQSYDKGLDDGYIKGINETDATGFSSLLATVFGGLGSLLAIELLPNIYIGSIIAVPLVFGIIFFIIGKRKGD